MSERDDRLRTLLERLEEERDELKVKLNLAKLEAREEWEELEEKIEKLRGRLKGVGAEARDASGDVGAAFAMLVDEVKEGLARIRRRM